MKPNEVPAAVLEAYITLTRRYNVWVAIRSSATINWATLEYAQRRLDVARDEYVRLDPEAQYLALLNGNLERP